MKYAFFDASGRVESSHNDDTVSVLPINAVLLDDTQWDSRFDLLLADGNLSLDPISRSAAPAKWSQIKAERDRRKVGGVNVGDHWFHNDDASRIQHMSLVMMGANIPADLRWKTMGGTFVSMTPTLASSIFNAIATNDQAVFANAERHRLLMEASIDPSSYDYSSGWPAIYGE